MSCKPKFTCDKTFYLILTIYEKHKYYEGQTKKYRLDLGERPPSNPMLTQR